VVRDTVLEEQAVEGIPRCAEITPGEPGALELDRPLVTSAAEQFLDSIPDRSHRVVSMVVNPPGVLVRYRTTGTIAFSPGTPKLSGRSANAGELVGGRCADRAAPRPDGGELSTAPFGRGSYCSALIRSAARSAIITVGAFV
jgi:hypothetical protein